MTAASAGVLGDAAGVKAVGVTASAAGNTAGGPASGAGNTAGGSVPAAPKDRLKGLKNGYKTVVRWALDHRIITLGAAVLLLALSVGLTINKGFIFMPEMSTPQIAMEVTLPEDAEMDEIKKTSDTIVERVIEVEGVETVGAMLSNGSSTGMTTGDDDDEGNVVNMYVLLKEDNTRSSDAIDKDIQKKCKDLDCEIMVSSSTSMTEYMSGAAAGVAVKIYGDDIHELQDAAEDVGKILEDVKGIDEVDTGIKDSDPEIHFTVDRDKAIKKGLTTAEVYAEIQKNIPQEKEISKLEDPSGKVYDIILKNGQEDQTVKQVKRATIKGKNTDGDTIKLKIGDIADIEETRTLSAINRNDQRRYLQVNAQLKKGYNVTKVTDSAERALKKYKNRKVSVEVGGESETIMDAMKQLVEMLLLGIVLVYLVMVAQFQSLRSPFIIMFTIPLAFTGGLLALAITGKVISVISMLGFVMMTGIIVNNGIVLVDYINQLRGVGLRKRDAIIQAGLTRVRPILMTSITTIMGLSVMALGRDMGTDIMQPIALVCIGGLVYATLMTLIIVPVMYDVFNREKYNAVRDEDVDISGLV